MEEDQFECLGFGFLGDCAYNPLDPHHIYFSLGEALAALGLILVIIQFLKPIYLFRLKAYGIRTWQLLLTMSLGATCTLIAAFVPNLSFMQISFIGYPIFWEILGFVLIGGTYLFAAFIAVVPAKVNKRTLISFVRAGALLLSEASDADRIELAQDIYKNLKRIFEFANVRSRARHHEVTIEFERLESLGLPASITGHPPISSFYRFTHRKELALASYAASFLEIISDPKFCITLVERSPWLASDIIALISKEKLYVDSAQSFVRELAKQTLISPESMMVREIGHSGFRFAPLLSESIFCDPFILRAYRPLNSLWYANSFKPTESYIKRLDKAGVMMLETALEHHGYWGVDYMYDVKSAYKAVLNHAMYSKEKPTSEYSVSLTMAIQNLYRILMEDLETRRAETYNALFVTDPKQYRNDLVSIVSELTYEGIESISNNFTDFDDPYWHRAHGTYSDIFPHIGEVKNGLNPLQQSLCISIIDKVKDNMGGWYPALTKVMLAVIGPYNENEYSSNKKAYQILTNCFYRELKKLPNLYKNKPDKLKDYLPDNIKYNPESNTLTHTYRFGNAHETCLDDLKIPKRSLLAKSHLRIKKPRAS